MFLKSFFSFVFILTFTSALAHAQQDDISQLISSNNTFTDIESSIEEETSTTTIISPQEHIQKAEMYLQENLFQKAQQHINAFKNTEDTFYGKYLEVLIMIQKGEFENAYNALENVKSFQNTFQDEALNIQAELSVTLAWIDLNQNNLEKAEHWLTRYNPTNKTRQLENRFNAVSDAINIERIKSISADNTYGRPLKVALLLPLSGVYQTIGQNMLEAAQLALFQQPNPNILLYPHDTQSSETGARLAAQKAISDQSNIIIGPLTSTNTRAIKNYTNSAGIPLLTFSSDFNLKDNNTLVFGHEKNFQAVKAAEKIADLGVSSTAVLAPNTPYGIQMSETFQHHILSLGVSVTNVVYFDPTTTDYNKELKILAQEELALNNLKKEKQLLEREFKLVGAAMTDVSLTRLDELKVLSPQPIVNFEALYLPVSSHILPLIASQLAFYDMDSDHVKIVGSALWHDKNIYKNKGEYIKGAYYPAPSESLLTPLKVSFKQHYNKEMLPISSLAYDAVKMITKAYIYSDYHPNRLIEEFYRADGYLLSNGPTKFLKSGVTERLYDTYEVRTYSYIQKEKAPLAFPPALPNPLDPRKKGRKNFFNPWGF